ncbi:Transcription factor sdnS-like protein [Cladobotryum mycophilum]|uniref:Transcription factor sdnS-like protein n=1 Tax=Cladobotryum mycophilum TaxID=491253 RepID=A0ABR0S848_9HYPO
MSLLLRSEDTNEAPPQRQLRKVRKGTRSCWECKRRKIRCIFSSENVEICNWCLGRGSKCISQQYSEAVKEDNVDNWTLPERMGRLESLMERLIEKTESVERLEREKSDSTTSTRSAVDNIGIDVVDHAVSKSAHPAHVAVASILQNSWFQSELGLRNNSTPKRVPKLEKISRSLLTLMPSRQAIEVLDAESSAWINQLLQALPSFQQPNGFSLIKTMPFGSSSLSHPTVIARSLMCVVICLQQLPKGFDITTLGPLTHHVDELVESITSTISSLITSDDELIATPEGIECLFLQTIFFINSGKPRRAWLSNRRALAVAQIMGLHVDGVGSQCTPWSYIIHSDRYLSLILGFPCGSMESDESSAPHIMPGNVEEKQQDVLYMKGLHRIAARIINKEQSSTQSIDNALENLASSMPQTWWRNADKSDNMEPQSLAKIYHRLNIQLWHHQLCMALHLPFMLDQAPQRKHEYSRFSCLAAARGLISTYLSIRTSFGMFLCCMTNFQAFTAAVMLLYNLSLPNATFEVGNLPAQKEADWNLVGDVMKMLDQDVERFEDAVAAQASNVLKILQMAVQNPQSLQGDNVDFTIPYFGTISIARKAPVQDVNAGLSTTELPSDYDLAFIATIDRSQLIMPDGDELLQQWLVDDHDWSYGN